MVNWWWHNKVNKLISIIYILCLNLHNAYTIYRTGPNAMKIMQDISPCVVGLMHFNYRRGGRGEIKLSEIVKEIIKIIGLHSLHKLLDISHFKANNEHWTNSKWHNKLIDHMLYLFARLWHTRGNTLFRLLVITGSRRPYFNIFC